jgi:hypothetical protein
MRSPAPSSISTHCLARFTKWAMLWVFWFAVFLSETMGVLARRDVRRAFMDMRRVMASLVFLHAIGEVPPGPTHKRHAPRPNRIDPSVNALRRILGARFRRALRGRSVGETITRFLAMLRDLKAVIAGLVRRLKRGLTRWMRFYPARESVPDGVGEKFCAYLPAFNTS